MKYIFIFLLTYIQKMALEYHTDKKYIFYVDVINLSPKNEKYIKLILTDHLNHPKNFVIFYEPKEDLEFQFKEAKNKNTIIILTSTTLRAREMLFRVKKLVKSIGKQAMPSIFLMNELDSYTLKTIFDTNGKIKIYATSSLIFLGQLIFYIFLTVLFISVCSIIFIFVTILAEKDPIILPGMLERCLKIRFGKIANKFCGHCVICMDDFTENDLCRYLGCGHYYHVDCVDPWLEEKSSRCPLCSQHLR
ncbi:ubiquitin--- ligase [Tubulinosema ratisbonensis]|uniref:Ubiquitin---ligase n=1 Tax=Tubulinosema ratisbonensis TaxID=291195 RepID=A0A437AKC8_9MICR|nr:ubiquitin--- ligase [Tubulinosema ratisbonensis]